MKGGPVNLPWQPEEEQFIIDTYARLTARKQAERLERDYSDVVAKRMRMLKKSQLDSTQRAYHPPWTKEQEDWLRENYHKYTMRSLRRHLHRTETAIILRKRRLGIIRTDGFYTCNSLAEIFGCDPKKFASLYNEGYLKGKRAPYLQGSNRPWVFNEGQIARFLRQYPWLMDPKKMQQQHYFRSVLRQEWDKNPWLNSNQAAELVGVHHETILRRLLQPVGHEHIVIQLRRLRGQLQGFSAPVADYKGRPHVEFPPIGMGDLDKEALEDVTQFPHR